MLDRPLPALLHEDEIGFDISVAYLDTVDLIARLHRLFLEVISVELRRRRLLGVNAVQALLLFRTGHNTLTPTELAGRGAYQGSNISYNLSKLVECGYLHHQRNTTDGRSVLVSLTERGRAVHALVAELFERHADELGTCDRLARDGLGQLRDALLSLERYWLDERLQP